MQALIALVAFAVVGIGLVVAGAYVLLGIGPALILLGVFQIAIAALIRAGMRPNA